MKIIIYYLNFNDNEIDWMPAKRRWKRKRLEIDAPIHVDIMTMSLSFIKKTCKWIQISKECRFRTNAVYSTTDFIQIFR